MGKKFLDSDKKKSIHLRVARIFTGTALIILLIVIVLINLLPIPKTPPYPSNTTPSLGGTFISPDQASFIFAVTVASRASDEAPNDMVRGGVRSKRRQAICDALKDYGIDNWVGEVKTLSSNSDGKGVLAVSLGENITLTTSNNSFSDRQTNTLIDPQTSLFSKASSLKVGQKIHFSGNFFSSRSDCVREDSLTLEGSLKEPEFIFRFSSISEVSLSAVEIPLGVPVSADEILQPPK